MWTHSGIFIEVRDGKKYVWAGNPEEYEMFAKDEYGTLADEWLADLEPLKEDGLYQVIIGYGSFWEGTNPHGNKTLYGAYKICDPLNWQPHAGKELLGGGLYDCLECAKLFRSTDGNHISCLTCRDKEELK